ncbi:Uncharacterised protein [Yersinia intermedia]|nr:Uncharacterised protein [Yersinia intermedia]CNJ01278.1 Uncharacterised protein [Yersinia intermedia]
MFNDIGLYEFILILIRITWSVWILVICVFLYLAFKSFKERDIKDASISMAIITLFTILIVNAFLI